MYWDHAYLREKFVFGLHGVTIVFTWEATNVAVMWVNHKTFLVIIDSRSLKSGVGTNLRYEWFEYINQQEDWAKSGNNSISVRAVIEIFTL